MSRGFFCRIREVEDHALGHTWHIRATSSPILHEIACMNCNDSMVRGKHELFSGLSHRVILHVRPDQPSSSEHRAGASNSGKTAFRLVSGN